MATDAEKDPPQLVDHTTSQSNEEYASEESNEEDMLFPEGNAYPLNSKKVVADLSNSTILSVKN